MPTLWDAAGGIASEMIDQRKKKMPEPTNTKSLVSKPDMGYGQSAKQPSAKGSNYGVMDDPKQLAHDWLDLFGDA